MTGAADFALGTSQFFFGARLHYYYFTSLRRTLVRFIRCSARPHPPSPSPHGEGAVQHFIT